ncbi:MAG: MFS transporter [Puniceicoccaceae bacterium]|jgi:glycoside/pentoside/hexuronide:cation symporter, GPH family|nr:MFS transporter [Puniceicoccaceae bacterium]
MSEQETIHWESKREIAAKDKVPIRQKISYGFGGLSDFFIQNTIQALAIPIFAVGMGLDPLILGFVLAGTKIVSAVADPLVGMVSDRTRSRWGRRKPFLIAAAVIAAVLLPFVFRVPDGNSTVQFGYIAAILSFYFLTHSFFAVPYMALGYELTDDYDERTNIFAWKSYIGMIGIFAGIWAYWFTLRPVFGNEMNGAQVLGAITGVIIIIGSIMVTRGTREIGERHAIKEGSIPVREALKTTMTNRSFLMIQGAVLVVALGIGIDATIGMYLHVHYTCGGDKEFASVIGGFGGTLSTGVIFVALGFGTWLSKHLGKRQAALAGLGVMLLGGCSIPWAMSPVYPWLIVVVWVLHQFGSQISNLLYGSMMADVCDEDELNTGERREGSYAAAGSFLNKSMQVLVLALSGAMPRLAGYVDTSVAPSLEQLERMKVLLYSTDIVGVLFALALLWFYPLTRERCRQIRVKLSERNEAAEK